ncbi:hypothetical protein JCM11641_003492 [Rhodosporidiobolus odoratus]
MHSLKAIHDSRRTRPSTLHSRLPVHSLAQRNGVPASSLLVTTTTGTHRLHTEAGAGNGGGARQRQVVNQYWAAKNGRAGGRAVEEERWAKEEQVGSKEPTPDGRSEVAERGSEDARKVYEGALVEEAARGAAVVESPRQTPHRTASSDFELIRHVPAAASVEEKDKVDLSALQAAEDEEDWELLGLEEEDALRLGYQPLMVDEGKPWASVVVKPVAA